MCSGDAFCFCSSDIPNFPAITACMYMHRPELSSGCRAIMDRGAAAKGMVAGRRTDRDGIAEVRRGPWGAPASFAPLHVTNALRRQGVRPRNQPGSWLGRGCRRMIRFLFVVPFLVFAPSASAQQVGHDACARDATRFCRPVLNDGDQAVLACLKQHRARISKGCDKVMTEHGQ
jgi:hypothetical protein